MTTQILVGDCRTQLRTLDPASVDLCVTSPPYWGLRDYKIEPSIWGGVADCPHEFAEKPTVLELRRATGLRTSPKSVRGGGLKAEPVQTVTIERGFCVHCGAWRGCYGLEPTYQLYVEHTVEIFREVWRVLKPYGTLWLNIGDCYANSRAGWSAQRYMDEERDDRTFRDKPFNTFTRGKGSKHERTVEVQKPGGTAATNNGRVVDWSYRSRGLQGHDGTDYGPTVQPNRQPQPSFKQKDRCGIPWRVAMALQADYYGGRIKDERDRIWLAAMIDGEGCLFIHRRKAGGHAGDGYKRKNDTFSPGLEIANTSRAVIERCAMIAGCGSVSVQGPDQNARRRQTIYRWSVRAEECRKLIRELYPHFVAKADQARLIYGCPSSGDGAASAHQALMDLHGGRTAAIDFAPPPTLFEPGYYLRQEIIWAKKNPMPESTGDRPTTAHEQIFLFAKSGNTLCWRHEDGLWTFTRPEPDLRWRHRKTRLVTAKEPKGRKAKDYFRFNLWRGYDYYYDAYAIMEPSSPDSHARAARERSKTHKYAGAGPDPSGKPHTIALKAPSAGRIVGIGNNGRPSKAVPNGAGRRALPAEWKQGGPNSRFHKDRTPRERKAAIHPGTYAGQEGPRPKNNANFDMHLATADLVGMRNKRTVWSIATMPFKEAHFATFPPKLIEPCILAGRPKGGTVLDPFGGAGTTAYVAELHGRNSILIEINPAYAEMARERIARLKMGPEEKKRRDIKASGKVQEPKTLPLFKRLPAVTRDATEDRDGAA